METKNTLQRLCLNLDWKVIVIKLDLRNPRFFTTFRSTAVVLVLFVLFMALWLLAAVLFYVLSFSLSHCWFWWILSSTVILFCFWGGGVGSEQGVGGGVGGGRMSLLFCFSLVYCMCTLSNNLIDLPLGVIGRLCLVIVTLWTSSIPLFSVCSRAFIFVSP